MPSYYRPPLSKGFLLGVVDRETLPLRGENFYRDNRIEVVFGARVESIDRPDQLVESTKGRSPFSKLALARGQWDHECVAGRWLPGEGEFPLMGLLAVLPCGVVVSVDTPSVIPADIDRNWHRHLRAASPSFDHFTQQFAATGSVGRR